MLRIYMMFAAPGSVLRAFPGSESLSSWNSKAIAFVESGPPSMGRFAVTIDDNEPNWAIFKGALQPAHFGLAIDHVRFQPKFTVTIG